MSSAFEPLIIASRFLAEIDMADTTAGCLDALQRAAEEMGWFSFGYGWAPAMQFRYGESYPVMTRGLPTSWKRDWGRHGRHDPYMEHACSTALPFSWSQVIEKGASLSHKQRDCISYVHDAIGTSVALTIPVHVFGRRPAFLSLIGERCRPLPEADVHDEQAIALMRLLVQSLDNHLFGRVSFRARADSRLSVPLSPSAHPISVRRCADHRLWPDNLTDLSDRPACAPYVSVRRPSRSIPPCTNCYAVLRNGPGRQSPKSCVLFLRQPNRSR